MTGSTSSILTMGTMLIPFIFGSQGLIPEDLLTSRTPQAAMNGVISVVSWNTENGFITHGPSIMVAPMLP